MPQKREKISSDCGGQPALLRGEGDGGRIAIAWDISDLHLIGQHP